VKAENEEAYISVLRVIENLIGGYDNSKLAPDRLAEFAREAYHISADQHVKLQEQVRAVKPASPPTSSFQKTSPAGSLQAQMASPEARTFLRCVLIRAEDLLPKDVTNTSDPYAILRIVSTVPTAGRPFFPFSTPQGALLGTGVGELALGLLPFRQYDIGSRDKSMHHVKDRHADAHQEKQSTIKPKTLNPVWNESTAAPSGLTIGFGVACSRTHHQRLALAAGSCWGCWDPFAREAFEFEINDPECVLVLDLWDSDADKATVAGLTKVRPAPGPGNCMRHAKLPKHLWWGRPFVLRFSHQWGPTRHRCDAWGTYHVLSRKGCSPSPGTPMALMTSWAAVISLSLP
jgi:hypothetical protein